jgi:hypothetical protein
MPQCPVCKKRATETDLIRLFVHFVDYVCIICASSVVDPVCTPCGHVYCGKCIRKWFDCQTLQQVEQSVEQNDNSASSNNEYVSRNNDSVALDNILVLNDSSDSETDEANYSASRNNEYVSRNNDSVALDNILVLNDSSDSETDEANYSASRNNEYVSQNNDSVTLNNNSVTRNNDSVTQDNILVSNDSYESETDEHHDNYESETDEQPNNSALQNNNYVSQDPTIMSLPSRFCRIYIYHNTWWMADYTNNRISLYERGLTNPVFSTRSDAGSWLYGFNAIWYPHMNPPRWNLVPDQNYLTEIGMTVHQAIDSHLRGYTLAEALEFR